MNSKFLILLFFGILTVFSCKKDDSNQIPKFEGFSLRESPEDEYYSFDDTDWRIDDKFSKIERDLFDTLKFESSFLKNSESSETIEGIINGNLPKVIFYPNPTSSAGYISFNFTSSTIMNIVIVDQKFNKKIEYRGLNQDMAFNLSTFSKGKYRMYYVLQDSTFKFIGLGHGDIIVGNIEDI